MTDQLRLEKAIVLAIDAHRGQKDKQGKPVIMHLLQVMLSLVKYEDEDVLIASVLHDIVEDTPVSLGTIELNFGAKVATIVDALTRREDEQYMEYIARVKKNSQARLVKLVDLKHNIARCGAKEEFLSLLNRYRVAMRYLIYSR